MNDRRDSSGSPSSRVRGPLALNPEIPTTLRDPANEQRYASVFASDYEINTEINFGLPKMYPLQIANVRCSGFCIQRGKNGKVPHPNLKGTFTARNTDLPGLKYEIVLSFV